MVFFYKDCPKNYTGKGGKCIENCPQGWERVNGTCERPCQEGTKKNGKCEIKFCPKDTVKQGDHCVHACPLGTTEISGKCYSSCPKGTTSFETKCKANCKSNEITSDDKCTGTICDKGVNINGKCIDCPVNSSLRNGKCYKRCNIGDQEILNKCYKRCPYGYVIKTDVSGTPLYCTQNFCIIREKSLWGELKSCPPGYTISNYSRYSCCKKDYKNTNLPPSYNKEEVPIVTISEPRENHRIRTITDRPMQEKQRDNTLIRKEDVEIKTTKTTIKELNFIKMGGVIGGILVLSSIFAVTL